MHAVNVTVLKLVDNMEPTSVMRWCGGDDVVVWWCGSVVVVWCGGGVVVVWWCGSVVVW